MANLQPAPIRQIHTNPLGVFTEPWIRWFQLLYNKVNLIVSTTKRVTSATYNISVTDSVLFYDTDSTAITTNLPAGNTDYSFYLKNVGSSGNAVTIVPSGIEVIEDNTIYDGESFHLRFDSTEGWRLV